MRRYVVCFILALFTMPAAASEDCRDLEALDALYGVRGLLIRGAPSWSITSEIDDRIRALREPLAEGGFRWVRLVRPPAGQGPSSRKGYFVKSASETAPDLFESEGASAWAVSVVVPRKRSLLRANNESWVGDATITCTIDGRSETRRESIRRWMKPDTTHTVDLGGSIAQECRVRVETATKPAFTNNQALVEIHIRQAVEQDDPANPNHETIRMLDRVRTSANPETLDYEIARLERRLFPSLDIYPFTRLLHETREARRLLRSEKEDDRDKGAKMLDEVVKEIEKK
jgi:hypothetical protein